MDKDQKHIGCELTDQHIGVSAESKVENAWILDSLDEVNEVFSIDYVKVGLAFLASLLATMVLVILGHVVAALFLLVAIFGGVLYLTIEACSLPKGSAYPPSDRTDVVPQPFQVAVGHQSTDVGCIGVGLTILKLALPATGLMTIYYGGIAQNWSIGVVTLLLFLVCLGLYKRVSPLYYELAARDFTHNQK